MNMNDLLTITHTGDEYEKYLGAVVPPIFMNSLHVFPDFESYLNFDDYKEDSFIYGRESNPTAHIMERKIAELEHGTMALAFASGMAAGTAAVMATCSTGSHIICLHNTYGPLKDFISRYCAEKFHMTVTFLHGTDLEELEAAIRPETSLIILESPATFVFTVVDLEAIAKIAKKHHVTTYIDNSCCSPYYQKPLDFGIDIVMHTMSKYLGGHSDVLGGVVLGSEERMDALRGGQRASWGACMDPFAAWLLIRSLRTLEVRMARHSASADKVARFLQEHPRVRSVCYPGLETDEGHTLAQTQMTGYSGLMSFVPDADNEAIHAMVKSLDVFEEGPSWGGFESVVNTPGLNPNREMLQFEGIPQGLVRISVGLEDADTLIEDLDRALNTLPR